MLKDKIEIDNKSIKKNTKNNPSQLGLARKTHDPSH